MARLIQAIVVAGALWSLLLHSGVSAAERTPAQTCSPRLAQAIPPRSTAAPSGSSVAARLMHVSGQARDALVSAELRSGNIPSFQRHLQPVSFSGKLGDGKAVTITICVTPDYLAVGADSDFIRIPLGLPTAVEIADLFGFLLPTTKMVDAIYTQARVRLAPSPMPAGDSMRSTDYLWRHNHTVDQQRAVFGGTPDELTAGQKKDLVLSNRLRAFPGRVAIYGWHREEGKPIQPLSTVHGEWYADYSHGVRLVSATAFVDGTARPLMDIFQDPDLAPVVSSEGPIPRPEALVASLYVHAGRPSRLALSKLAGR